MVELAPFLRNLGLSQYTGTFSDNDIDGAALLDLEETHLKELGLSLGHRVRLMKAIVELRMASGGAPAPVVGDVPASKFAMVPADVRSTAEGERRQLTVMFADLVGSTELAARADPEDVRDVMRAYQDACAGSIAALRRLSCQVPRRRRPRLLRLSSCTRGRSGTRSACGARHCSGH